MRDVRETLRLQAQLEARIRKGMQNEITRAMRAAAQQVTQDGGTSGLDSALASHKENIYRLVVADYSVAAQIFGEKLRRDLGLPAEKDYDPFMEALAAFMRTYGAAKVQQIASTTRKQIVRILGEAEAEGVGLDEAARMLAREAPGISRVRAAVIARTETHTAAMFGYQEQAKATGLELMKEWVTVEDERAREDHAASNAQTVGMNEPFIVGGEELQYPGDPSASPEQTINCRCAMVHIPV